MILHKYSNDNYLDGRIRAYWLFFKADILALTTKGWNEEDLRGKSCTQYKVMQYYYLLYILILLYEDLKANSVLQPSWSYYNTKYNIDGLRKCLACIGIDIDKALAVFNFPLVPCINGLECMDVEGSFIVEPTAFPTSTVTTISLSVLLANPTSCSNSLVTTCPII